MSTARAAFEKWWLNKHPGSQFNDLQREGYGYKKGWLDDCWQAWQAASAPTTAYVTCPDCKVIHQFGKCREYAHSAPPPADAPPFGSQVEDFTGLSEAEVKAAMGIAPPQPTGTLPAGANILDEVSLLVSAVREFEQHSYVTGDPVGGCGECLRLFDRLIAQANTIEIAMRTKSRASRRDL